MRNILKYAVCCFTAVAFAACGDLYETHDKYLKMGEETYIGLADSLQANGGFKRVELKWKLNADPRISTCVITWNGSDKPLEVAADRSSDFMSKIIDLPEGKYIFKIVVKSDSGKESLPQTISGESYGDSYKERLPQKGINSFSGTPDGVTINWAPEEGCISVNLTYTSNTGEEKTLAVKGDATSTFISDYVPGSKFKLTSTYKPEINAIDVIESIESSMTFPIYPYYVISKADWDKTYHQRYQDVVRTGWTIEATTEEKTGEATAADPYNGQAVSILDGKLGTFWHSAWKGAEANPPLPHMLTLDMQQSQNIISVELARRQSNKDTKTVEFSISEDKVTWKNLGKLDFPNANDPNAMILLLPEAVKGRYLRATVTASNNGANASIAEIQFTSGKK